MSSGRALGVYANFYDNMTQLPKSRPNVIAHDIQPEKANQNADIRDESCGFAKPWYL